MGNGSFEDAPGGELPITDTEKLALAGAFLRRAVCVYMGVNTQDEIPADLYLAKAHELLSSIDRGPDPQIDSVLSSTMLVAEMLQWVRDEITDIREKARLLDTMLHTLPMEIEPPQDEPLN